MDDNHKEYLRYKRDQVAALEREATEHNANLLPEHEGYVRMDGPRRQYRAEVINGEMHYFEL